MRVSLGSRGTSRFMSGGWRSRLRGGRKVGCGGLLVAGAVAVGALWTPSGARAADVVWNVAGGGTWDTTSNNWTGGSPNPSRYVNGDNATFNNAAGGTINVVSGITPGTTTVSATGGTYTFAGSGIQNGFELYKSGAGRLVLSSFFNSFSLPVTVENAGGIAAMGNGAHLTLDSANGPALLASINIGILSAAPGSIAKVSLNRSEQIVDDGIVYFNSPAPQWAYFSIRGNSETISNVVSNASGGAIENGNFNGAINTDGTLTLAPFTGTAYAFTGIIRDADVGGGTGKLNLAVTGTGGGGTQVLGAGGTYTYTGTTTVSGGTLQVDGTLGATPVTVKTGGTLSGSGGASGTQEVAVTLSVVSGGLSTKGRRGVYEKGGDE